MDAFDQGHNHGGTPTGGRGTSSASGGNHTLRRAIICLFLLGGSVGLFALLVATRAVPPARDVTTSIQRVPVMEVLRRKVAQQWTGYGMVEAVNSADVPARVGATVIELPESARVGARVQQGELLVRLDDSDFLRVAESASGAILSIDANLAALDVEGQSLSSRLEVARKEQVLAAADVARIQRALEQGVANEREVEQAQRIGLEIEGAVVTLQQSISMIEPRRRDLQAKRTAQESTLARAQSDVARCRITSPIAGVLQLVDLEVGEAVTPGSRVARVVDPSVVEVAIALPAAARQSVRVGAAVSLLDDGHEIAQTAVARLSPEDDALSHTMTAWVELRLAAGGAAGPAPKTFLEATVTGSDEQMRTLVPRRSVRNERVFAVANDQVSTIPVAVAFPFRGVIAESGVDDVEWLVLREHIPAGTLVSLDSGRNYEPGAKVSPQVAGEGSAEPPEPAVGEIGGESPSPASAEAPKP